MKLRFILAGTIALLAVAVPCFADPYSITPWLKAKQSYSDNIMFETTDAESDFITSFTGGLTLEQNLERLETELSGQLKQFLYWDNNELDALDYNISGSCKYRVTERTGLNASARYAKDSQRDRDTDTTGLLVSGDRKSADISLGADYMVSELSRIELSVDLGTSDRHGNDNFEETDEDNKSIQVNITYRHDLSEYFKNTVGLFNLMYLHYDSEEESTYTYTENYFERFILQENASDVYQFTTGFSHSISELYSLFFQAGVSYTQTSEKQGYYWPYYYGFTTTYSEVEYKSDTFGGVLSTGIDYKNEYWKMGLALSQDVRGGTGTSGVVQRTSLSGNIDRKLSSDLSLTFSASAYLNQNERETSSDTDDLTFNLQPGFRYKLKMDFILSGAWRFTTIEDREDDTTKTRNLVYIDLRKEFDLKDF